MADALRHEPTSITLRIEVVGDAVRVEVRDDPGVVSDAVAGSLERQVARRLLDRLATNWGSDQERDFITTWFSLTVAATEHEPQAFEFTDPRVA
jgi:hypothetical protein